VGRVTAPQSWQFVAHETQFCVQNQHSLGAKNLSYCCSAIALFFFFFFFKKKKEADCEEVYTIDTARLVWEENAGQEKDDEK
jgi:hypothetical protein